ncbi:hypothetical protein QQ045_024953 [Rhodiola kirilowii]
MSTVVYQGLPSFLDPQLNESRALRLKLASPRSHLSHSFEMAICTVLDSDSKILFSENSLYNGGDPVKHKSSNPSTGPPQLGGLSFLQTLSTISQKPYEKQSSYFHPSVKRASSMLSDKSLELCTENLGSETGTDIIEDENNIFSSSCVHGENQDFSRKNLPRKIIAASSRKRAPKTFPPPLSTMMGSDTVQVRPIRENGRLILQAVKVQPRLSFFQADRSNGRLRLRLLETGNSCSSSDLGASEDEYIDSTRDDTANDDLNNSSSSEGQQEPQDMVGNSGSENVEWQGRSKEGGNGNTEGLLLDSESLWVATS